MASKFYEPVRSVNSMDDMALWKNSTAYYDIIGFIKTINWAVQGRKLSKKLNPSRTADNLLHIFDALNKMIDETPPPFDNWFEKMKSSSTELLKRALPLFFHPAIIEVGAYFIKSFANATRSDEGRELAFIMFLCALYKKKALVDKDNLYVGLKIFNAYLQCVRRLQLKYRMEPAGSHSISSMDDQHVPFIWGSAQLSVKEPFEPNRFLETDVIKRYKDEYYFIGYIDHNQQVESGSSAEHSSQLESLSSLDSWEVINSVLIDKYEEEFLGKFPVIQHMLFGSILELKEISSGKFNVWQDNMRNKVLLANQQAIMDQSTTIWEMILTQLRWTTISNKISKLISGRKH